VAAETAYRLLDSGHGRKLEQIGPYRVERQAATAWWKPRLSAGEWKDVDLVHHRSEKGGGHWEVRRPVPEEWVVSHGGLQLIAKATPFGHLGLFAEQAGQWGWLRQVIGARRAARPAAPRPRVLNLFAYTGGATIACARAGAQVTHVDAARGVVDWARRNAERNDVAPDAVQWLVDDALAFAAREVRRGRRYDGVILDPPSFGRGAGKQVWKIEDHLPALLAEVAKLLAPEPLVVLLSAHSPGFGPIALSNLLDEALAGHPPAALSEEGEMSVADSSRWRLPSGTFARRSFAGA
jgi:23S rRNA (cytosine1962-C5)-methyltransferase